MRVISGLYGGRRLISPKGDHVRPTSDRAKENMFNVLQGILADKVGIDLFCGSGAIGIEMLSRKAQKVYFCDKNEQSLALAKDNLSFVPVKDYELLKGDYRDCLNRLAARKITADIIFCDPPYGKIGRQELLDNIFTSGVLNAGGRVVIEHNGENAEIKSQFTLYDERVYGEAVISFYALFSKAAITGSFNPFTNGHKDLVEKALTVFDRVYAVILVNPEKTPLYSVEQRLEIMRRSVKEFGKRVIVDYFEGMTVDYCAALGIKYIVRGVRTEKDWAYEREMAEYNFMHGGVKTLFVPAKHAQISSSAARESLLSGGDGAGMLAEGLDDILLKR